MKIRMNNMNILIEGDNNSFIGNNVQIGNGNVMINGTAVKKEKVFIKCSYCGGQKEQTVICPGCGAR